METQLALDRYLNSAAVHLKPTSIASYRRLLTRFLTAFAEIPEKPETIEMFLAGLNVGALSKHNYWRAIRGFYIFLHKRYQVDNPTDTVRPPHVSPKVMPTCEPAELRRIMLAANTPRDRSILTIFYDTGIRPGELRMLRPEDVHDGYIIVNGKTGERQIPVSEETMTALHVMIAGSKNGLLFPGYKGQPLTRAALYDIIRRVMRRAGITGNKLGPYRLRHSFGKGFLVNGGDIRTLQLLMGHRSISTTQVYANLNLKDLTEKHHQFTPLRSLHAAAQESFLDRVETAKEESEGEPK